MKNKILVISGKIINVLIIIGTFFFGLLNFENITYASQCGLIFTVDPTKSLNAKYQYWIEDIYGREKGLEINWKIRDFTVWIINNYINQLLFVVIALMMLGCVWINKKLDKKMNIVLKVFFIFSILVMLWTIFVAGPDYVDTIYDS